MRYGPAQPAAEHARFVAVMAAPLEGVVPSPTASASRNARPVGIGHHGRSSLGGYGSGKLTVVVSPRSPCATWGIPRNSVWDGCWLGKR